MRWPMVLPDGERVIFVSIPQRGLNARPYLAIASLETGRVSMLDVEGIHPLGVLNEELVFASRNGTVMAVRFNTRTGTVSGTAFPLVEDVIVDNIGDARVALSATGTLVYLSGSSQTQPVVVDARGTATPLIGEVQGYSTPRYNPDGTRILFWSGRAGRSEVWWGPADGSGAAELLHRPDEVMNSAILSPDGAWLLYYTSPAASRFTCGRSPDRGLVPTCRSTGVRRRSGRGRDGGSSTCAVTRSSRWLSRPGSRSPPVSTRWHSRVNT